MKTIQKLIVSAVAILSFCGFAKADDKTVTAAKLLNEMIDRETLAVYPSPDYYLKQASSYDRNSVAKDAPGWTWNNDRNQFVRTEEKDGRCEYVMMDEKGPGAIVRFWMTFAGNNGGNGIMRIYIDDMDKPVITGTAFEILSGGLLVPEPLSTSVSPLTEYERRGHDLYYPITYSNRCKVTYESEWVFPTPKMGGSKVAEKVYYNIDYREYAPGTRVESFSWQNLKKDAQLVSKVNEALARGTDYFNAKGTRTDRYEADILPGETASVKLKGPRAITRLEAVLDARDKEQALRSTVVEIVFDGNSTVWCPLGDFIGIGYEDLHTSTWTANSTDGRYTSLWVMPFKSECELILHNYGQQTVSIKEGKVISKSWRWNDRSMYFGTNWTTYTRQLAGDGKEGRVAPRDIAFTRLKGKGVYVGDAIALFDSSPRWWGEGDEKIYVDGETFPSSFGTGTEDYYGYAWCRGEVFTGHPFIAQPSGSGDLSVGYTSNSRYRSLDRIPFRKSLDFDMELWHWDESIITYAPTSFWYILPGGRCEGVRQIEGVKDKVALTRSDIVPPVLKLCIEGEDLLVEDAGKGVAALQQRTDNIWSFNKQLWCREAEAGDSMTASFISPIEGRYDMLYILTYAPDYGTVSIEFNGVTVAENINLYSDALKIMKHYFDNLEIKKGRNTMTVHFTAPAEGQEKCMFGIDKIELSSARFKL